MKIRTDFVTNSSSSSFIVTFSEVPTNAEELKRSLFGDDKYFVSDYNSTYSAEQIAMMIFDDMKEGPISLNDLSNELKNSELDNAPDYDDYKDYGAYNLATMVFASTYIDEHFSDLSKVYRFRYGNETSNIAFEDSDLFKNVEFIKISHH